MIQALRTQSTVHTAATCGEIQRSASYCYSAVIGSQFSEGVYFTVSFTARCKHRKSSSILKTTPALHVVLGCLCCICIQSSTVVNIIVPQISQIPLIWQCSKAQAKHSKHLERFSVRWPTSGLLTSLNCLHEVLSDWDEGVFIIGKNLDELRNVEKSATGKFECWLWKFSWLVNLFVILRNT